MTFGTNIEVRKKMQGIVFTPGEYKTRETEYRNELRTTTWQVNQQCHFIVNPFVILNQIE